MLKSIYHLILLSILLFFLSCSALKFQQDQSNIQAENSRNNPLIIGLNETINFKNIQVKDIRQATNIVLRDADEILVLELGHIIERGAHETLVTGGGHYQRLNELGLYLSDQDLGEQLGSEGSTS